MKSILILGGYGATGRRLASWLLRETDCRVILAGRHAKQGEKTVTELCRDVPKDRVAFEQVDAGNQAELEQTLKTAHFALDATSSPKYTEVIAQAALKCGVDYLDIHYPTAGVKVLRNLEPEITKAGRCFITQGGFHPGILNTLVRYAAPQFDRYQKAILSLAIGFRFESQVSAAEEFIQELQHEPAVYRNGAWQTIPWSQQQSFDFGPPFGIRTCVPLNFLELHTLPKQYPLEEVACYVNGFNPFINNVVLPLGVIATQLKSPLSQYCVARLFHSAGKYFSTPPYGVVMQLHTKGQKEGRPHKVEIILRHPDCYDFTAIPVVACLRQYLNGTLARPGVWFMGEIVEPDELFNDLQRMGVEITTRVH